MHFPLITIQRRPFGENFFCGGSCGKKSKDHKGTVQAENCIRKGQKIVICFIQSQLSAKIEHFGLRNGSKINNIWLYGTSSWTVLLFSWCYVGSHFVVFHALYLKFLSCKQYFKTGLQEMCAEFCCFLSFWSLEIIIYRKNINYTSTEMFCFSHLL